MIRDSTPRRIGRFAPSFEGGRIADCERLPKRYRYAARVRPDGTVMSADRPDGLPELTGWRLADGEPVSCEEKLKVLNENLSEIRQTCQDAFEDAVLMGCDEDQVRSAFAQVVAELVNPYRKG